MFHGETPTIIGMAQDDDFDLPEFRLKLGRQVSRARKSKGYSMDRLALEAGFSRGTMSKIEAGISDARASTLFRAAEILDVPIGRFFEFKKPR